MSRCTGHCCRAFVLNIPYEDLLRLGAEGIRAGMRGDAKALSYEHNTIQVANMVIPLDVNNLPPDAADAMGEEQVRKAIAGGFKVYTCKHLNRETGDCTIYEQRPNMCRDYPYTDFACFGCRYPGCTAKPKEEPCEAAL